MTREEKALIYFKDLRERKVKDYSVIFDTAPKDSVVYGAASAEIEIYDTTIKTLEQKQFVNKRVEELEAENKRLTDLLYEQSKNLDSLNLEIERLKDGIENVKAEIDAEVRNYDEDDTTLFCEHVFDIIDKHLGEVLGNKEQEQEQEQERG